MSEQRAAHPFNPDPADPTKCMCGGPFTDQLHAHHTQRPEGDPS